MNRPSVGKAAFVVDNGRGFDIRGGQVGKGPLIELWVSEHERKSTGAIVTYQQAVDFYNAFGDLLDDIEEQFPDLTGGG